MVTALEAFPPPNIAKNSREHAITLRAVADASKTRTPRTELYNVNVLALLSLYIYVKDALANFGVAIQWKMGTVVRGETTRKTTNTSLVCSRTRFRQSAVSQSRLRREGECCR
jgi:hypothetical protein